MKISIVIPAYNEEERIVNGIREVQKYLAKKPWEHEIIVVDDGSKDKTAALVKEMMQKDKRVKLFRNVPNRGKGYSVRRGMLAAKGDYVLFTDADMSTPMRELDEFLKHMAEYDIAIGSRNLAQSRIMIKQPKFRQMLGKTFPFIVRTLLRLPIKDTQCGFKLFSRKAANDVFSRQRLERFAFDAEVLFIALRLGLRIKELPVEWTNDPRSKVRVFRDSFRMLRDVVRVWRNAAAGRYR